MGAVLRQRLAPVAPLGNQSLVSQITYNGIEKIPRQFADRIPRPPLSVLIDHIAKVADIDHVGLGADFDGINNQLPESIDSAADLPKITEALMARGYSAEDCRKILGRVPQVRILGPGKSRTSKAPRIAFCGKLSSRSAGCLYAKPFPCRFRAQNPAKNRSTPPPYPVGAAFSTTNAM